MLTGRNLSFEYGGHPVFSGVSLSVNPGEKVGLIGKNGVGKSTLLRILSGELTPTSGEVIRAGLEVGRLPQTLDDWEGVSVRDFMGSVTGTTQALENLEAASEQLTRSHDERSMASYQAAYDHAEHLDVFTFDSRLEQSLAEAGLGDLDTAAFIDDLSGGQRNRLAMAAVFAAKYDVILLDEPTNNLDPEGIVLLEAYIQGSPAGFLVVSHDRRFLRQGQKRILEMRGDGQGIVSYGMGYDEYVEARARQRASVEQHYAEYETERDRLRHAARNMARTAQAAAQSSDRATDNDKLGGNYRRERAGTSLAGAAQSMQARLDRLEEPERPSADYAVDFAFNVPEKGRSDVMLSVRGLTISYERPAKGPLQLGPYQLSLGYGERLHISGRNGSGKSSMLDAIFGHVATPHKGSINFGPSVRAIYIDQHRTLPDATKSAVDNVMSLAPDVDKSQAFNQLVRLGVSRDVIAGKATTVSPGERTKILLAAAILTKANLLVLDEPTNHLDIPAIEGLEKALNVYEGTLVVVSHDREFIDAIGGMRELSLD